MISHFDEVAHNSNRVLNAAKIFDMPVMATEQYPKVGKLTLHDMVEYITSFNLTSTLLIWYTFLNRYNQ